MPSGIWLSGSTLRYVAKVAVAALAAFALTLGGRNEFALFSAMGAAMVVGGSLGEDLGSSLNRVRGTLVGTAVGLLCALLLGSSLAAIGVAAAAMAWLCMGLSWGAAAMRIGLAMALVILFTHGTDPTHYALWRVLNTLVGVVIGLLVGRLLWPIRGRDQIASGIDALRSAVAAALEALAKDAPADSLLAREVGVLDALAAIRTARKSARMEQRVHRTTDLLGHETMLGARAGVATLDAAVRLGDLAGTEGPELPAVRGMLGALTDEARARSEAEDALAAASFTAREAEARRALAESALPAEARAALALVLDELSQLQGTLQALREARRERKG